MNPSAFNPSRMISTVSSSCNNTQPQSNNDSNRSTGSSSSTNLNQDPIFSPNAWWRSFGNEQDHIDHLISTTTSGNVIQDNSDSCSVVDWDSFFAPSSHHEPKVTTISTSEQPSCKITINPNFSDVSNNFNYSMTTTPATNNNSNLDVMITLLNRILIMNGVNPDSNQCQTPNNFQHPNMETNSSAYVNQTAQFTYTPIQSFSDTTQTPSIQQHYSVQSQSNPHNTSVSSSSSSDSDSTGSHHSSNSIGKDRCKISKKKSTRPRLKFQKEADKSIKFNLVTSEELAASLIFHDTLAPTSGKRNRGRPKKSEASPQKPKAQTSTNIEFMVNCYDQCSKIFK